MIIDPLIRYIDIDSSQWWNFRARRPGVHKPGGRLLVLHESQKPVAAAIRGEPLAPLPSPFEDARELARQLYAQYHPVDSVWVYDQHGIDEYTAACSTWPENSDLHDYHAYQIAQAEKLSGVNFAVYPLSPVKIGYLKLEEAQRFLCEELPAKALLILAIFEGALFFSLVVEIQDHLIRTVTTSDHYARQLTAAGYSPDKGILPFNRHATGTLEKLAQEEFGAVTVALYAHRNVYDDLFVELDRAQVLRVADLRGDAWGSSALPKKYDAWQKTAGVVSYIVFGW